MQSSSQDTETTPLIAKDFEPIRRDDIETRWHRWKARVTKGKQRAHDQPEWLISIFQAQDGDDSDRHEAAKSNVLASDARLAQHVEGVKQAIAEGIHPQMIQTGSSGSYFAKVRDSSSGKIKTMGVFKPSDEEPYGNLNPKRAFLRRYFWWALGRPCLVPGFSAMSEAGASLLDDRLQLGLVPKTRLVSLSSSSFHYSYRDRKAFEELGHSLPEKVGSFQSFLHEHVMVSTFLRRNPFPSRPLSVLERDIAAEQRAHRKSRKPKGAKLRQCGVRLKYFVLCRDDRVTKRRDSVGVSPDRLRQEEAETLAEEEDGFLWTPTLIQSFRLELEKLVVLDFLFRNTDRGFDNFMVQHIRAGQDGNDEERLVLGAIDNSLGWPLKHPDGIRDYPFGWLYLPSEIIGGPFSQATRDHFLPLLSSPQWWRTTVADLKALFQKDGQFEEKLFESQMAVFKGQGWNVVQCLQHPDEGPIELCARQKKVVRESTVVMRESEVLNFQGGKIALTEEARLGTSNQAIHGTVPLAKPIGIANGTSGTPSTSLGGDAAQPRSLPETSALALHHGPSPASPVTIKGPYASSLGIEVLESLNRASSRSRRPTLKKGLSGFDLGRQRQQSHERGAGTMRPRHPGRHESEGASDFEGDEIASVDEESALTRMTQSDYFAQHQRDHQARRDALPSIGAALSKANRPSEAAQDGAQAAVTNPSSADAATSLRQAIGNKSTDDDGVPGRRPSVHRRMRSLGQWPVASFSGRSAGHLEDDQAEAEGNRLIKVIVERLIDDRSLPWQAYLRA